MDELGFQWAEQGWREAQRLSREFLYQYAVDLRDNGPWGTNTPSEYIGQAHDKEPADSAFREEWPAFTIQQTGHGVFPPKGDFWFPNIINFAFRIYYPVVEGDVDGLKLAQDMTINGQGAYLEHIFTDPEGGDDLRGRAIMLTVGDGRVVGAEVRGNLLQGYETDLYVQIH